MSPLSLEMIKAVKKDVVTVKKVDAYRAINCPMWKKTVNASAKDVSVAKYLARHFNKSHKNLTRVQRDNDSGCGVVHRSSAGSEGFR